MEPKFEPLTHAIGRTEALDRPAEQLQGLVKRVVPDDSDAKDVLSGTWLGHPLHPPLTDFVIGAWTSATVLDLLAPRAGKKAADRLVFLGVLGAVPTAVTGLSDWADLWGHQRRVGLVHATGNVLAVYLQMKSWWARKRGKRVKGITLSLGAMGLSLVTAYLGGHLSFRKGVGVAQTAFEDWPQDFTAARDFEQLPEGQLTKAEVNGIAVLLYRTGARVYALSDRCPHRGCSLSDGQTDGTTVTCPCHGSTFRLEDGELLKGPATSPAPSYQVRRRAGKVEIRLPVP